MKRRREWKGAFPWRLIYETQPAFLGAWAKLLPSPKSLPQALPPPTQMPLAPMTWVPSPSGWLGAEVAQPTEITGPRTLDCAHLPACICL